MVVIARFFPPPLRARIESVFGLSPGTAYRGIFQSPVFQPFPFMNSENRRTSASGVGNRSANCASE